jgi:peptidoglycan/xylan/chitin deacetylase (PgdA/CDA1 family)
MSIWARASALIVAWLIAPHVSGPLDASSAEETVTLRIKSIVAGLVLVVALCAMQMLTFGPQWRVADDDTQRPADLSIVVRSARNLAEASEIPALVHRFVTAGVREVWVQFKQDDPDEFPGGVAFYPSAIAPVAPGFADDRLRAFIDALDQAGIRVCAWVPCFNDESAATAHPEWRARTIEEDGSLSVQSNWLCPRNDEAIEYQAAILSEVVARYPKVSAIYTDFIRFDDDYSCGCDRCMKALREEASLLGQSTEIQPADVRAAGAERSSLWKTWTQIRAEAICQAVDQFRDRIDQQRADMWFGACVLPFSAKDYSFNTQSGQDYYEMARVGLDELVLMGYWDDWDKSPEWLRECVDSAHDLVRDECKLSVLLDGDMAVRRTWLTLEAVRESPPEHWGYFHYGQWTKKTLEQVGSMHRASRIEGAPRPSFTAVAVRIDTEPDYQRRYDTVRPEMIRQLVDMFDDEGVSATFVTCGRLVEFPGHADALRDAAERGHEIASHAYDHEQLDSLSNEEERLVIAKGLDALAQANLKVTGFGAPRNSITAAGRDALIEHGLAYDGSAAYDPLHALLDAEYAEHSSADGRRILVVPFIIPNDWDALHVKEMSVDAMVQAWRERLDAVTASGEPVFVLDVHQWIASRPEVLDGLRAFIREARDRSDCRVMTLNEAAAHVRAFIRQTESRAAEVANADAQPGSQEPT